MEISSEIYNILGILCYLNYPNYLNNSTILSVKNILDKIEEEIEEIAIEVEELENNNRYIKDCNDKAFILDKIKNKKTQIIDMKRQLHFIKI